MIIVKTNGIVDPFGLHIMRDSEFGILAPLREYAEEIPGVDGEMFFGSEFTTGEHRLKMINTGFLNPAQKDALISSLSAQLYTLKDYDLLVFESVPNKAWRIRLGGKIEMPDIPGRVQLTVPITYQPFRVSVDEYYLSGQAKAVEMSDVLDSSIRQSGFLINQGSAATPLRVEIVGPVTNPSVIVGGHTFTYTGTLTSSDTLKIDTKALTVTFNGVNALASFTGMSSIKLQPGGTSVTGASAGVTTFKWYDLWA